MGKKRKEEKNVEKYQNFKHFAFHRQESIGNESKGNHEKKKIIILFKNDFVMPSTRQNTTIEAENVL